MPITEIPASPPRLEAPLAVQAQEGGGESQHQTPPEPPASASNLPDPFKETLGPFAAQLKTMAEDLPLLVSRAVKDSLKKLQEENFELKESNLMIRAEAEKLTCNLLMNEMEHSRLEDALDAELRNTRKEASDLRQKLHIQLQEKIDLESKLVPFRVKVADLEAARKAEASRVEKIEKRSADREILLGKVEADRDNALAELSQAREEATKVAAELAQARGESKKATEELARAHEEKEELKNQIHELDQSVAQILTSGFEAALEQMSCQYPELDLSMLSICNEVVDGKIVPSED
ncbi:filament-like plant protein 1 [Phaseolus vulgaris]|uniref:filament-like plant protein 1 n=1 Tax=Phaseolus vulgaris TaxID=3885 RepID=UPI0035CB4164